MTELAEIYLGNIQDNPPLKERLSQEAHLEVYLNYTDGPKGRIHVQSTSGVNIGLIKSRHWSLREGDVFVTQQGNLLIVHLEAQKVMVLSFTESITDQALSLIHLGHVLGNHHWPIVVQDGLIYIQLTGDEAVIESTILNFAIEGLKIDYQWRGNNEQLNFSQHHHIKSC